MGRVKISSPDSNVTGSAYLEVNTGKSQIILVNGHWNKILNNLGRAPGAGGEEYWKYFLGDRLKPFFDNAKLHFNNFGYQTDPIYIDGSTKWGGDESGSQRKNRGYRYASEHFSEIKEGVGSKKVYLISHSEGCAFAAGVAKYLMEKGVKVGESIMLAADEGDEFSVEGNYPCYQIVAGWLDTYKEPKSLKQKTVFVVDPVVGDHIVKGVDKYGVFIKNGGNMLTVHEIVETNIFDIITQLKNVIPQQMFTKEGTISYFAVPDPNQMWHKINDRYMYNKRIDSFYHNHMKRERKD